MTVYKFFLALSFVVAVGSKVPEYIHLCHSDEPEPQLAKCIISSITALLPRIRMGIPELNIPPTELLQFKNVELNTGTRGARIATNLTDVMVWGASYFKILELKPILSKNYFRFKVHMSQLKLEGNYALDSTILLLELKGKGRFHLNVTNFLCDCILQGEKVIADNEEHLKFEKMKIKVGFEAAQINLDNLFNGDPVLGKSVNDVINENVNIFFEEMRPNFEEAISSTFTDIANKITLKFNYKELFPKSAED